ncbi:MAG: LON peptidase substrate-binding domain-containing protein [Acidimicrobiales bacterium]|nr:LON peptidase substrate-binding domain-containing protein [Acidimicrobiales bacterium]
MAVLPMFPLGSVLFPTLVLPLHIFEERYRALIRDVLEGDDEFGVTLIERGSEVGGGEDRLGIGTIANVQEAAELPDGRWAVIAVGTRRIQVDQWLDDDPYPRAEVSDLPDPDPTDAELEVLPEVTASIRRALAKVSEIGDTATPATTEFSDDPVVASYQLSALSPLSTIDQHRLLCAPTVGLRLAMLQELLPVAHEILDSRLGDPGSDMS